MTTLSVFRGDDVTFTLTFTDSAGDAVDITNYIVFFTVKTLFTDTDANAKISKDISSHTNAAGGITLVVLTDSDTDLDIGQYEYDIQIKDDSALISTVISGKFVVMQDVTTRIS